MRFLVVTAEGREANAAEFETTLRKQHPDVRVDRLRADPRLVAVPRAGDVYPQRLDLGGFRWADFVVALGPRRAAWAALPWALGDLVSSGDLSADETLVVLDDTFTVSGPVGSLFELGDKLAARARHVDEALGAWGGFAPGLLVAPADLGWAEWWKERSLEELISPGELPEVGGWWQLPLDAHTVIDPALCLSATTAGEIDLDDQGHLASSGRPPSLIDLAGFDPARPWWFAPPHGPPTALASTSPGLRRLCAGQVDRLVNAGWVPHEPSEDTLVPGVAATPQLRTWYRSLLAQAERGALPANPLVAGQVAEFVDELAAVGDPNGTGVSCHVDQIVERRPDLAAAFPHARWKDRRSWRRWLWSHGLSEGESALLTLPDPPGPTRVEDVSEARRPFGVNLVGYLGAELGLGVVARRLQHAFDAAGIPHSAVSYDRTSSNLRTGSTGDTAQPYHFNLMLITPDQLPLFVEDVGERFLAGHHNIGLWYWESDVVAPQQEPAFDLVDEVWVATRYLTRAFAGEGRKPVRVVPAPLVFEDPEPDEGDRRRLGLDDRFTFLFSFDYLSVAERKNPAGVAEAYRRAFPDPAGGTRLVLKSINGDLFPEERERLAWQVADRPDVEVRDELLSAVDRLALVAAADCYVSLHRSEGLGLTMAEAMAVGTPVIATAYSGNMDFMDEASAMLVPSVEVEVGPGRYYPAHGHWADPDLAAAADMMIRVNGDQGLRRSLASQGRRALQDFSYGEVGTVAREALLESWRSEAD